jgi:S1-C subfamily serine protease
MRDNPRYFQISVPVQPGNSGGALVDERGNVVGLITARLNDLAAYESSGALPQNVNYALKGAVLYNFLDGVVELSGKLKSPNGSQAHEAEADTEQASVRIVAK